jgi:hypothetical protein
MCLGRNRLENASATSRKSAAIPALSPERVRLTAHNALWSLLHLRVMHCGEKFDETQNPTEFSR